MATRQQLVETAQALISAASDKKLMIATAESCTGGLIAAFLTEVPGSSAVVDRGFVTYSNEAKQEMLGVKEETLQAVGAVSADVALEMAHGAIARSKADIAVAVTGIAGPGGGTTQKPVGTVHIAVATRHGEEQHFAARFGDPGREAIRLATVAKGFELIDNFIR